MIVLARLRVLNYVETTTTILPYRLLRLASPLYAEEASFRGKVAFTNAHSPLNRSGTVGGGGLPVRSVL